MASELPGLMLNEIPREFKDYTVFGVYRPSFVLEKAKDKFKHSPIRINHKWLDETNKSEIIGYIDEDVTIKHNKDEVALCASLNFEDSIDLPSFKELSPGYTAVNEWRSGVAPSGEEFQIICTEIKEVNHLAIVNEARGGEDMKILDGGKKLKVHSGLVHFIKKKLKGVNDGNDTESVVGIIDSISDSMENYSEEELSNLTNKIIELCKSLPDSEEKEKLVRYVADIPLLKGEEKAVADEALSCIKESYKTLDSDAVSDIMEKAEMPEEEKKEVATEVKTDDAIKPVEEGKPSVPGSVSPVTNDEQKTEKSEEKTEDGENTEKRLLDLMESLSKRIDSIEEKLNGKQNEVVADEKKEEVKDEGCKVSDSAPSLQQYTQSLSAIEKGYSLDDAFAKLKGRR